VVRGRRFVAVNLAECIDMDKEIPIDEDLEMSDEKIAELKERLRNEKTDRDMDDAWHKFHGTKPEEDVKKFSGGGVVDGASFSRGTGAQVRGRIFRGVF
jgi:hypothetical protein